MAGRLRAAARTQRSFECPNCDAFSAQIWSSLGYMEEEQGQEWFSVLEQRAPQNANVFDEIPLADGPRWILSDVWVVSTCVACSRRSIWRDEEIIYPSAPGAPAAHPDMPGTARSLYDEARRVLPISRRAGTAMARATLERLLRDLDPEAKPKLSLDQRIGRVTDRVSSGLGGVLDVIRHAGNKSVHAEDELDEVLVLVLDDEDVEVVELLFSAINELVDELITKPNRHADLVSRLPQSVQDQIMRRGSLTTQAQAEQR